MLHIYWFCHLQSNKGNWRKTGSNEPSCFLFFVCICIVFVCAEKRILFPQPKKHLLWIVYWVPWIKAWLLSQKWLEKWHHGAHCLSSLSPCLGDLLEHIFLAQLPVLQSPAVSRKIRVLWTPQGHVHYVIGKLRAGALWDIPFASHLWTTTVAGFLRAPTGLLLYIWGFFVVFFFLVIQSIFSVFFTCAGNEIGEADRQDENIIPTSKGKQKIHFGQIQDSCMWEVRISLYGTQSLD